MVGWVKICLRCKYKKSLVVHRHGNQVDDFACSFSKRRHSRISLVSGLTTALKAPRRSALTWPRGMAATGNSLTAAGDRFVACFLLSQADRPMEGNECCRIVSARFEIVATISCKVVEDDAEVIEDIWVTEDHH